MLMDFESLYLGYSLDVTGILHIGAHLAEEVKAYARWDIQNVWWVEANPDLLPRIDETVRPYGHKAIQALVTDKDGEVTNFNVTNYDSMSSSVFEFGTHTQDSPDTVYIGKQSLISSTIDSIVKTYGIEVNYLNLDIQGAELLALKGATETLKSIDYIYTEVSTGPVYVGGTLLHEIDEFLSPDFKRVKTDMGMHRGTHGDAFYVRTKNEV